MSSDSDWLAREFFGYSRIRMNQKDRDMRDVFPYAEDREMIRAFLAGYPGNPGFANDSGLSIEHGSLKIGPTVVAWIAPSDGALYGKICVGVNHYPAMRMLNYLVECLGIEERITTEEAQREMGGFMLHWFFGDNPIILDHPILLAGPLGVQAHRAGGKP